MKMTLFSMAVLAAMSFSSCKKVATDDQPTLMTENSAPPLKQWYEKQITTAQTSLNSSGAAIRYQDMAPVWDETQHFDASHMYIVPMELKAKDAASSRPVSKYLVIETNAQGAVRRGYYCYVLSKVEKPNLTPALLSNSDAAEKFEGALVVQNLNGTERFSRHYKNNKLMEKEDKVVVRAANAASFAGGGAQNNMPENCDAGVTCIDWYWQTYVDGILTEEDYLYTTCHCTSSGGSGGGGGGGGGGQGNGPTAEEICNEKFDAIVGSSGAVGMQESATLLYANSSTRSRAYKWRIFAASSPLGGTIYLASTETGVQYLGTDNKWHWQSLTHGNISTQGGGIYDVTGTTNTAIPTIGTGMLDNYASMALDFNAKITFSCGPFPLYSSSDDYSLTMGWYIDYAWIPRPPIEDL